MNITKYSVQSDNFIRIYQVKQDIAVINKSLVDSGVNVSSLQICMDNLEDYFKKVTGGEGIA